MGHVNNAAYVDYLEEALLAAGRRGGRGRRGDPAPDPARVPRARRPRRRRSRARRGATRRRRRARGWAWRLRDAGGRELARARVDAGA